MLLLLLCLLASSARRENVYPPVRLGVIGTADSDLAAARASSSDSSGGRGYHG